MSLLEAKVFGLATRDPQYNLKDGLEIAMSIGTLMGHNIDKYGALIFTKVLRNSFGQFMTQVDSQESYFQGQSVFMIDYANYDTLVACLSEN